MIFSNPSHRQFFQYINSYYDSPSFQKIKNNENYSIYVCKISSLLLHDKLYLIAMCPIDNNPLNTIVPLLDLNWICFQARSLNSEEYDNMDIMTHTYEIKKSLSYLLNVKKKNATKEYSTYVFEKNEYPIDIILLHTHENEFEYPSTGNFISCLETFQTILQFQ